MASVTYQHDLNLGGIAKLIGALMDPVASDPGSPTAGQLWYNTTDTRLKFYDGTSVQSLAILSDVTGGAITGNLWNAQTVLVSVADNDPQPVTFGPETVLGRRSSGDLGAVTFADLATDLLGGSIDAATLEGSDLAAVLAAAASSANTYTDAEITALKGAVSTDFDTLVELAAAISANDTELASITTALAARTQKAAVLFGDGAALSYNIDHNLGSIDCTVQVYEVSSGATVMAKVSRVNANRVTVETNTAPASNAYKAVVVA